MWTTFEKLQTDAFRKRGHISTQNHDTAVFCRMKQHRPLFLSETKSRSSPRIPKIPFCGKKTTRYRFFRQKRAQERFLEKKGQMGVWYSAKHGGTVFKNSIRHFVRKRENSKDPQRGISNISHFLTTRPLEMFEFHIPR